MGDRCHMKITTVPINSVETLAREDFFEYLTRVVLLHSDSMVKEKRKIKDKNLQRLKNLRGVLEKKKGVLIDLAKELEKKHKMLSVLNKIDSLRKEGVLIGKNKEKIQRIINEITTYNLSTLRKLEGRLDIYAPSLPKMTYG